MSLVPLTKSQKKVYDVIASHLRTHFVMPTINDIRFMAELNSSATVSKHLHVLAAKGWIEQNEHGRIVRVQAKGCSLCPACGQKVVTQ